MKGTRERLNSETALKKIARVLAILAKRHGVRFKYGLIGALAVGAWGVPRATEDIDFLVSAEGIPDAEIVEAFERSGIAVEIRTGNFFDPIGKVARLTFPHVATAASHCPRGHLIIATKKWEHEFTMHTRDCWVGGENIPVLAVEPLIAMKLKAAGGQDFVDAERLISLLVPADKLDVPQLRAFARRLRVDLRLARLLKRIERKR